MKIRLPERLIELRQEKGITQAEMARRIGIHRGTYSNYESGKRQPDYEILEKLTHVHGVTFDYIFGRSDVPTMTERQEAEIERELDELMEIVENLPKKERKRTIEEIINFGRFLADSRKVSSE